MINKVKLNNILVDYKRDFDNQWGNEKFKWIAVQCFQQNWDIDAQDFYNMLEKSLYKTSNLLSSMRYYPRGMILEFAKKDPEAVRKMFINLFDESKKLVERFTYFRDQSEELRQKYGANEWKSHYQNANSISTYLWLRYPDKYYIYKYSEYSLVAKVIESDFIPKRTSSFDVVQSSFQMYDEICDVISTDYQLISMLNDVIDETCYKDKFYKTLTIDVGYYISNNVHILENVKITSSNKYDPHLTKEDWKRYILEVEKPHHPYPMQMLKALIDFGGEATCKQLSEVYGGHPSSYIGDAINLGKRVKKYFQLPACIDNGKECYYVIPFIGNYVKEDNKDYYSYRIRPELMEALQEIDLSDVSLYYPSKEKEERCYWWLNANSKIWNYYDVLIGETKYYSIYNDSGNKRRIFQNFLDVKEGDFVIGYQSKPFQQITAICKISQENNGETIGFKKIETLQNPINYNILKNSKELENMEFFINPQGSLFKMTKYEFDFVMDIIREENPLKTVLNKEKYSKEKFLDEVYMEETTFDTLKSVLLRKKNIILQGAPGVGKTYCAKRLAYAILNEKNDDHIEMIQFHQNYTYEDFVMGYKPNENGFKLTYGIFYQFCQKAQNDPESQYFFIIDEINRGNMSKIFGELLMLIEAEHRNEKITLGYSGTKFYVPDNLYIIGMMNTADRSLALIDYALRRRFSFFELEPGFDSKGFKEYQKILKNDSFDYLIQIIKELNKAIENDESLGKGFCIGHSYFCNEINCTEEWMKEVVYFDILPMLQEYWFDNKDEFNHWKNILSGVFDE